MDILPLYDFITSGISHLENTGSLSYSNHPKVDMFLNLIYFKKTPFINTTTDHVRKNPL